MAESPTHLSFIEAHQRNLGTAVSSTASDWVGLAFLASSVGGLGVTVAQEVRLSLNASSAVCTQSQQQLGLLITRACGTGTSAC